MLIEFKFLPDGLIVRAYISCILTFKEPCIVYIGKQILCIKKILFIMMTISNSLFWT